MTFFDPVILFFVLGVIAQLAKSDLKIPDAFYDTISIYLLLAIGIKGGIELAKTEISQLFIPGVATIILGASVTLVAYALLRGAFKFENTNAIAIAAHYGSCSAVTYAVVANFLNQSGVPYEKFCTVLLVFLEIPGIMMAVALSQWTRRSKETVHYAELLQEVFLGKTVLLLVGGVVIGVFIHHSGNNQMHFFFFDLFKGFLAIFMLEMGVVTAKRFGDIKTAGISLVIFGIVMPLVAAGMGMTAGILSGLSPGGTIVLATLAASASYIAAPAAVRIILPEANISLCMTAALAITFPFNIIIGIPLYHHVTKMFY